MSSAIEVHGVSKSFRRYRADRPHTFQEVLARGFRGMQATERFWALRDVSFTVPRGRAVGIIGTNGSGKSTLLRLVGGIGAVDSGRIDVTGRISALLDLGSGFHQDLTGRENVMVAGVLAGLSRREVLRRFDAIVAFSEIEPFIDNPMRTYSSGMRMRLAFATNVHTDPDILLIDEVLAVGDAAFQPKCIERIQQFKADGCSILLVSHGLAVMQSLCEEALWMHHGQLMAHGAVGDMVRRYEDHIGFAMDPDDVANQARVTTRVSLPEAAAPLPHAVTTSPRVQSVALFDVDGRPIDEFRSGQPLRAVVDLDGLGGASPAQLRVDIVRNDGLVCFAASITVPAQPAERARATLVLERLDVSAGLYSVDAAVASATAAPQLSTDHPGCPLVVAGDATDHSVLAVPHRWELQG